MIRVAALAVGVATLAAAWLGPLPALARERFSAHMALHMSVVAIGAPLIAIGFTGPPLDLARRLPRALSPVPLSIVELVVVWAWHAPALHRAARTTTTGLIAEQAMFAAVGLLLWLSALAAKPGSSSHRAAAGVLALLLTSMHMTLLGALLALSPRPLYGHHSSLPTATAVDMLHELHVGGTIMLLVGGAVYLAGGLWLSATLLSGRVSPPERERR